MPKLYFLITFTYICILLYWGHGSQGSNHLNIALDEEAFQLNANCPLVNSVDY